MFLIYITFSNLKQAERISKLIIKARLAACYNLWPIRSGYWWQGKIQSADEAAVILKTKKENYKKIEALVKKLHSYQTPCIWGVEIKEVEKNYLKWLKESLK